MSGRTFTYQGGFDDFVKTLLPDVELSERRKSVGVADSMLREVEEFLNRFAVTALNDDGDVTFDAAGTYIFNGDVSILGGLTITADLESSNWVSTTDGWKLFQTGTAEFNDALNVNGTTTLAGDGTVSGDFTVSGVLSLDGSGAFQTDGSGERAVLDYTTASSYRGLRPGGGTRPRWCTGSRWCTRLTG